MNKTNDKNNKKDDVIREIGYIPRDILKKHGLARKEQEKKVNKSK